MDKLVFDKFFLSLKAIKATPDDLFIGDSLRRSLAFYKKRCVGMAANMIGYNKAIIAFYDHDKIFIMYNPEILESFNEYETSEGCLVHKGVTSTKRFKKILVSYYDEKFQPQKRYYNGFTAQIIQHEIDHLKGILI